MPKRKRDYRKEYQRRLERALLRGLTKTQARGHPRAGELSISEKARILLEDMRIQDAIRAMRRGDSLAAAARSSGLSSERLRKFMREKKIGRKRGRKWELVESRLRWEWTIFSEGRMVSIIVSDPDTSATIAKYLNAVRRLLDANDAAALKPFRHTIVRDASGKKYRLETNPNTLYRLAHAERETPEDFYRYAV